MRRRLPTQATEIETTVSPDEIPAEHCPYCPNCGNPFAMERLWALHRTAHRDEWIKTEHEDYKAAYESESDELFIYHLKVVAVLVFFVFSYIYVFVWI